MDLTYNELDFLMFYSFFSVFVLTLRARDYTDPKWVREQLTFFFFCRNAL